MHVLVAGGGISGLAAALHLTTAGADVTLVEASDRLGGIIRTSPFAGRAVDEGADAFLVRTPPALDLARRVGLGPDLVHPAQRRAMIWHDGALHPLPSQVMGVPVDVEALAGSDLLTAGGLDQVRRDLSAPASPLPAHDVTIDEALGTRLGPEAMARLVDPLVGGINAGSTARQSLAAVTPQLDAARRDPDHASLIEACRAQVQRARFAGADPDAPIFAAPEGGMARLPQAVAAAARASGQLEVRLGVGLALVTSGPVATLTDGTDLDVDGVVVATPGHAAGPILADLAPVAAEHLAAVEHVSVAFVRVALRPQDVGRPVAGSGVLVPRTEGRAVTACSWASAKWDHLAPDRGDGTLVVRAAVGRDDDQAALGLDDGDLAALVVDDLAALVDLRGQPTEVHVRRWDRAFPQYRPGHLDRVAEVEAELSRAAPAVGLAGMHLRGVGIPASVASGEAAAAHVLAALTP
ncbi:MAG: protoporphyrinogen oxidase [Iamia sp.]